MHHKYVGLVSSAHYEWSEGATAGVAVIDPEGRACRSRPEKQYVESLRDGRKLHIDGKVVTDVTTYPPLQGIIGTIAALYDDQHDPAYRDILTYASPTTGEPVSATYLEARTAEEFASSPAAFTCARCAPSA